MERADASSSANGGHIDRDGVEDGANLATQVGTYTRRVADRGKSGGFDGKNARL